MVYDTQQITLFLGFFVNQRSHHVWGPPNPHGDAPALFDQDYWGWWPIKQGCLLSSGLNIQGGPSAGFFGVRKKTLDRCSVLFQCGKSVNDQWP